MTAARRSRLARPGLALLAASCMPLAAQVEARPELAGTVTRLDRPLAGATVVLHRVDAASAGEIDSVRAGPDGAFRFTLPTVPDPGGPGEIYFASVRHDGVLYFGGAISRAVQLDSAYAIEVFDTVSAPAGGAPLAVEVRYLVLEQAAEGWEVTDLLQVRHDGDRTLVAPSGGATWSHPLPAGAVDVEFGGGDLAPEVAAVRGDTLAIVAPIAPGQRQYLLRYRIPSEGDLRFPVPTAVDEVELLVREPAPTSQVALLDGVGTVELEDGVRYRRYTGTLAGGAPVEVHFDADPSGLPLRELMVGLALALAAVGLWAVSRGSGRAAGPVATGPATGDERDRLLLEVARLDEAIARADADEAERLRAQRADAVGRLRGGA